MAEKTATFANANKAYLYACKNDECRVRLFITLTTHKNDCPACNQDGEFMRGPLKDVEPHPFV